MFDVRKIWQRIPLSVLCLLAMSIFVNAQDKDKDQAKNKDSNSKKASANYIKVDGKMHCDKPETEHSIEVPDRPGHVLMLTKRKCTWTETMSIKGAKTKEGAAVDFVEKMEGVLHGHGFQTDSLDNGDKLTWQSQGQVLAEKGPATSKGRWSLMRGTGSLKGIKGGGTYEGDMAADGALTLEFEGVYDPSEMVGEKK